MDTLKVPMKKLDRRFGLWWVLATAVGWVVGFTICEAVKALVTAIAQTVVSIVSSIGVPDGALIGTGIGLVQWIVLRRYQRKAGWWIPATIIGFAIGKALNDFLVAHITGMTGVIFGGVVIGLVVGLAQYLVFERKTVKLGWWILGSTVGWTFGWTIINLGGASTDTLVPTTYIIGAVGAAVAGLITGATLIRLSQVSSE